jgi:hypothetical protein
MAKEDSDYREGDDQTWQAIGQEPRTRAFLKEMLEVVRGADQGFSAPGWP